MVDTGSKCVHFLLMLLTGGVTGFIMGMDTSLSTITHSVELELGNLSRAVFRHEKPPKKNQNFRGTNEVWPAFLDFRPFTKGNGPYFGQHL